MAVRNATLLYFAGGGPAAGKPCNSDPIPRGPFAFTVRLFPAQQEGYQLAHIEEPTSPPRLHPARAPPQAELDFELGAPESDEVDQEFPPDNPFLAQSHGRQADSTSAHGSLTGPQGPWTPYPFPSAEWSSPTTGPPPSVLQPDEDDAAVVQVLDRGFADAVVDFESFDRSGVEPVQVEILDREPIHIDRQGTGP